MSVRWLGVAAFGLLTVSCQSFVGVETRELDPLLDGCTLPSSGDGRIRVANFVPNADHVDFCVRPTGGAYKRPVLRGSGKACPSGFAFKDVSTLFSTPTGTIDVKTVAAGQPCSGATLSEVVGVDVRADTPVTLARIGGGTLPETIVAAPETTPPSAEDMKLRILNSLRGSPALYIGVAVNPRLPTDVTGRLIPEAVPFGGTLKPGSHPTIGTVDASGYWVLPQNDYTFGVAPDGSPKAIFVAPITKKSTRRSLFVVGDTKDARFPARGLICEDSAANQGGITTTCTQTDLGTLGIGVWNSRLDGVGAPELAARRPAIMTALGKYTGSDVLCISEVGSQADRDAIVAAAAPQFPYSAMATTDLDTQPTDPTDIHGATPPAPTSAPCGVGVDPKAVDDAYTCMKNECAFVPGSGTSTLTDSRCLSTKCAAQLVSFLSDDPNIKSCFGCMVTYAVTQQPFDAAKLSCTTDKRRPFGDSGHAPTVMLSKLPITNQETYVFGSTFWRRVILKGTIETDTNKSVDVYCTQVSPLLGTQIPYAGPYSNGSADQGWENEEQLQTDRLIAWVKAKSGTRAAVVTGDWTASAVSTGTGAAAITDRNPAVIAKLRAAFTEAAPEGYVPVCTRCPSAINSYNGTDVSTWAVRTYTLNQPAGSAVDANLFFNEAVVPLSTGATGMLSDTFGYNVQLLR